MLLRNLQAIAIALGVGGAALVGGSILPIEHAQAATVRPAVGKPLQAAISLANAGKGAAAMAKVHEAESVGGLTASEQSAISQTKAYIGAKTGAGGGATGCKAKFANDYNAGRYRDVVSADADCLRKSGSYDFQSQLIVAQAYYLMGNYDAAIRMLRGMGESEQVLKLLMSAAAKQGDTQTQGQVAERMVLKGQSSYWTYLLAAADATRGLSDHLNLDIYRVRYLTGTMRNKEDYELMTQLAIQLKFPTEALTVAQKGFDVKKLEGDRDVRLLNLAKTQAAKDSANLANAQKQANAAKNGDALVQLGENLWGYGKYPDSVNAIQAGIKKGVSRPNDANIALGIALLSSGQRDAALKAFAAVKNEPAAEKIAHLWTVYAKTGGSATHASAQSGESGNR